MCSQPVQWRPQPGEVQPGVPRGTEGECLSGGETSALPCGAGSARTCGGRGEGRGPSAQGQRVCMVVPQRGEWGEWEEKGLMEAVVVSEGVCCLVHASHVPGAVQPTLVLRCSALVRRSPVYGERGEHGASSSHASVHGRADQRPMSSCPLPWGAIPPLPSDARARIYYY